MCIGFFKVFCFLLKRQISWSEPSGEQSLRLAPTSEALKPESIFCKQRDKLSGTLLTLRWRIKAWEKVQDLHRHWGVETWNLKPNLYFVNSMISSSLLGLHCTGGLKMVSCQYKAVLFSKLTVNQSMGESSRLAPTLKHWNLKLKTQSMFCKEHDKLFFTWLTSVG